MKLQFQILFIIYLIGSLSLCKGQQYKDSSFVNSEIISLKDTYEIQTDSFQYYFPMADFSDTSWYNGRDTFINNWYSYHLFAMLEPVIYNDSSKNEVYRFTWLRTFHPPYCY
ncbi:MAG: hypothetical protein JXR53_10725 [Bacteroidales bacterium]|nr:hypothetical protein [Bacteroidales bacterium]